MTGLCREECQDVLEQKITGKVYTKSMSQKTSYTYYACCAKMRTVAIDVWCAKLRYPYSADARQLAIDGRIRVPHIHLGDKTLLILLPIRYL